MHTPASKRKNRKPRGQAIDTGHGAKGNNNGTRKNYALIRHAHERIVGKNVFAS